MDRIYVSIYYLKTLHYLFFFFAVFSLTAGMMFLGVALLESLSFFGLSLFYCISSLFLAYRFYKDYKEIIEPFRFIRVYFFPYISLVLLTIFSVTFMVWVFPSIASLMFSFLFINYYMSFVIIIGFVVSRFKIVSRLFEVYNLYILDKAKRIARKYALFADVNEYKIGSDQNTDEILDGLWSHRNYPLPYVRMLEKAICEKHIITISRTLDRVKDKKDEREKDLMRSLENLKEDYFRKIREIEQKTD
jgi:hypothetical protein